MSFDLWISLLILFFVGGLSPGPAVALILSSAFNYNRRAAMRAALGIASANLIWIIMAATGAAALLSAYPQIFTIMKIIGFAVILYLAFSSIFAPPPNIGTDSNVNRDNKTNGSSLAVNTEPARRRAPQLYRRGLALQLSSPMPLIYFGGILPSYFVIAQPLAPQILIMMITITITELLGLWIYAFGAQKIKASLSDARIARIFNISVGVLMIISGGWALSATL